jgi:hypothetical protein
MLGYEATRTFAQERDRGREKERVRETLRGGEDRKGDEAQQRATSASGVQERRVFTISISCDISYFVLAVSCLKLASLLARAKVAWHIFYSAIN